MTDTETIQQILNDHANAASRAIFQATGFSVAGVSCLVAYRDGDDVDQLERGRCMRCHAVTEQGMMTMWIMQDDEAAEAGTED